MNFIDELEWRGMIHNHMPGTKEQLEKEQTTAYVGIDPTADSLHIGHLVSIMMLKHLQRKGHKPIVLIGGATGMIGDPSGKSQERSLLDEETLVVNQDAIKKQLSIFLDFDSAAPNVAEIVNNYDWIKTYSFIDFIREVGKHITINYMMAKDSVKKRIEGEEKAGLSFTEFSYQLVQGMDFWHLYKIKNCKLQMGGSDQWGNITTGTELIRRKERGEAYAITCPLITKSDGGKFGKTETGNIWLSPKYTSPYKFYQFWLNVSDDDAAKYIKIFTILDKMEIDKLIEVHRMEPHLRVLQKRLAMEITTMIHGRKNVETTIKASVILFGKDTADILKDIDKETFLDIFEGVPIHNVTKKILNNSINIIELLTIHSNIFQSKSELRKLIQGGGVSLNKKRIDTIEFKVNKKDLLNDTYLLVQKGKKNYFIIESN